MWIRVPFKPGVMEYWSTGVVELSEEFSDFITITPSLLHSITPILHREVSL
jgi:hypothetical protein